MRSVLAAGGGGDLLPEAGAGEHHFRERIVRGAAPLHADEHAATRGGHFVGIEDDSFGKIEIDGGESGAANRQIVENIFVHEIGDVADDCLRMHVIGGWIFGGGAGEIEDEAVAFFCEGEMAGANQGRGPADGVVEDYGAEFTVGEGADFFARAVFGYVSHILRRRPTTKSAPRFSASSRRRTRTRSAVVQRARKSEMNMAGARRP